MCRKFREVWTCDFWDMRAGRQTYRPANRITSHLSGRGFLSLQWIKIINKRIQICCMLTAALCIHRRVVSFSELNPEITGTTGQGDAITQNWIALCRAGWLIETKRQTGRRSSTVSYIVSAQHAILFTTAWRSYNFRELDYCADCEFSVTITVVRGLFHYISFIPRF